MSGEPEKRFAFAFIVLQYCTIYILYYFIPDLDYHTGGITTGSITNINNETTAFFFDNSTITVFKLQSGGGLYILYNN